MNCMDLGFFVCPCVAQCPSTQLLDLPLHLLFGLLLILLLDHRLHLLLDLHLHLLLELPLHVLRLLETMTRHCRGGGCCGSGRRGGDLVVMGLACFK